MKTFEMTYSVTAVDDNEIDVDQLEKDLEPYQHTDLEFIEMSVVDPTEVHITFSADAESIFDLPKKLEVLNHRDYVEDPRFYKSKRISHTAY